MIRTLQLLAPPVRAESLVGRIVAFRIGGNPPRITKARTKRRAIRRTEKKTTATAVASSEKGNGAAAAAYFDGTPLDKVRCLEAKLIRKPDRVTSVQSFRDFGAIVKEDRQESRSWGSSLIRIPSGALRCGRSFSATLPDLRLYNNALILRRRISYVDGSPVGDSGVVFKFRHPKELKASQMDVRPKIAGKYRIKFKVEALPLKDRACA
jgi:hypothetical protein